MTRDTGAAGDEQQLLTQAARVESLLAQIEAQPDPVVRGTMAEIVRGLLALYGAGLERIVGTVSRSEDRSAAGLLQALAQDDLVAHLLLLHDLHPVDLEDRVARGLDEARVYLQPQGGDVELLALEDGVARVRLLGGSGACPSSAAALRSAVEAAVLRSAPDLQGVLVDDDASVPGTPARGFVPLTALFPPAAEADAARG